MPKPEKGEEKNDYISRCIKQVMDEGETDNKAAAGKCYGMWEHAHKKKSESIEQIVDRNLMLEDVDFYLFNDSVGFIDEIEDATMRCKKCGTEFKKTSGQRSDKYKCPECGADEVEEVESPIPGGNTWVYK